MAPKKQFALFALFISIIFALIFVYVYGAIFQHDRYWSGTVARVQKVEASIVANLLRGKDLEQALPTNANELEQIFAPLNGKLIIEITIGDELLFNNQEENWEKGITLQKIETDTGTLTINSYIPPSWNSRFLRWLKNPFRWFEISFDFITVPFILFFMIFLCFSYALGWRLRSMHLSKNVLEKLKVLEELRK